MRAKSPYQRLYRPRYKGARWSRFRILYAIRIRQPKGSSLLTVLNLKDLVVEPLRQGARLAAVDHVLLAPVVDLADGETIAAVPEAKAS